METNKYDCMHEELLQSHSLQIKAVETELAYKREKLDELKADNKRMEQKLDEINKKVNEIVLASKTDDDKLDKRLTAIETKQELQEKTTKENQEKVKLWIAIITFVFMVLTFYFNYLHHI